MIDFFNIDDNISDEMLAAYIDGNASLSESAMIEKSLQGDSLLSEAVDVAKDSITFGGSFDWDIHKGDFGFGELGLPPAVTEDDLSIATTPETDDTNLFSDGIDFDLCHDTFNSGEEELISLEATTSDDLVDTDNPDDWGGLEDTGDGF